MYLQLIFLSYCTLITTFLTVSENRYSKYSRTHVLTHDSMKAVFDAPPTFYKNLWKRVTSKCHENQIQLLVQTEGQQ